MKKGFTLIELLGVIALLGIIALIAIPAIDRSVNGSRGKLETTQQKQIIKGAKEFFSYVETSSLVDATGKDQNNSYCLPGNDNNKCYLLDPNNDVSNDCKNGYSCKENYCQISLACLKAEGYLPLDIKSPKTGKDYDDIETYVQVTKDNNNYKYEVIIGEENGE